MKEEIIKKLQSIIGEFVFNLPEEIKNQLGDLWFVFDENTLMFKNGLLAYASHEPNLRTITFYLIPIVQHQFDDKRLKELIRHEVAHALGLNEEEVSKLMNK